MKKNMIIIASALAIFSGISASAQVSEPVLDISSEIITINGTLPSQTENAFVDITLTNPGYTIDDIANNASIQYKEVKKSGDKGYFSFKIKVNSKLLPIDPQTTKPKDGLLTIYISGDDGFLEKKQIYFAPENVRIDVVSEILASQDDTELKDNLTEYKEELGLDSILFNTVDKAELAKVMFPKLSVLNMDFKNAQTIIGENAVITALNTEKSDILFADNHFVYEDLMKIKELDKEKDCTLKEIFDNKIKDEGKLLVAKNMYNKGFATTDDIIKGFAQEVILRGLSNPKESGYGIVDSVLTSKNAILVELNLTKYNSLADSEKITANKIIINTSYETIAELQKAIDNAADTAKTTNDNSSSKGGVGGGSSGSGSGGTFTRVVTENTEQPQNDANSLFNDMKNALWAKEAVEELSRKGVLSGVGGGSFNPLGKVTREQLAKIICLGFECGSEKTENNFSDVIKGAWYDEYVNTLSALGIINGVGENRFGVGSFVSRQDIAVMVYRALEMPNDENTTSFADDSEIAEYAKAAVSYLSGKGIVNGFEDNTFRPKEFCTRAQAAKIVYGALKLR